MALTRPKYSQIYDTDYKQSVRVATTADVGNLLATGNMTNTVDGVGLEFLDRILVKDQEDAKQNGIYRVLTVGTGSNGTWGRALDANANDKITAGMTTIVSEGDTNASKTFRLATPDPIVVGTTELTFVDPFVITASAGGANTHVQFNDVSQLAGSAAFTFNKTSNVLSVSGNVVSDSYFIGNGSQLTGIDATSIQSGTSNVKVYNSNVVAVSVNNVANVITVNSTSTTVTGNLLPSANVTYDLGSPSQRWRTGYFAANTIDLGGSTISIDPVNGFTFSAAGQTPVALSGDSSVTADIANLYANAGVQAGQITTANTNMKGYVDGQISSTTSAITTANTNLKGYTDNLVSTANVNLKGYVDAANTIQSNQIAGANAAIVSANTAMKSYVDQNIQGLNTKPSVRVATTGNLIATYNNGTLGVGATLTSTTNGAFPTIDGVTADTVFDGVLVKNQTLAQHNGRYFLSNVGAAGYPWILTRCTYCDEAEEIPGAYIFVQTGTLYGGTGWIQTVANPATFTVGTDAITVTQFSGAGTYTAGTGLTLNGTEFSVNASQTQITSVGTLGSLSVTGNITSASGKFIGDGSLLTGLPAGYTNANVTAYLPTHSGNVGASSVNATNLYGTIRTAAQTNITSVGTLGSLSVTGNISAANLVSSFGLWGTVRTAAQTSITSVGTLTGLTVSSIANVAGLTTTGSTNVVYIAGFNGAQIKLNSGGVFAGWIGNPSNERWGLGWASDSTGNGITGTALSWTPSNVSIGNTLIINSSNSTIAIANGGTNGVGNIGASGQGFNSIFGVNLFGTLQTASQTNITSVGTLTSGTWNANIINSTYGGMGVNNGGRTLTVNTNSGTISFTGAATTLTVAATASVSGTNTGDQTTVSGNAGSATVLQTARTINGVSFNGSANITVTAAAGTLTGSTLASGVTASSLTSVGTLTALTVSGAITVNSGNNVTAIVNGGTNGVGNIGASGQGFNTVFAKSTSAQYADLAEVYTSDRNYIPATVVVFGGDKEVTVSTVGHDPSVAGVVSTNPAYLMNDSVEGVAVALQGRVPCRVLGPVNKGDRVVSSDIQGVAERLDMTKYQPGCIIGKALESISNSEIATIEVVVGRN